jgi:hypothetical protein
LPLVEGVILMVLVPLYWPLIGLPWRDASPVPSLTHSAATLSTVALHSLGMPAARLSMHQAQHELLRGQLDERGVSQKITIDEAIWAEERHGL